MSRDLKFSTLEIREKGGLKTEEPVPAELIKAAGFTGEANAELEFSVGGSHILLQGNVAGRIELECARCLETGRIPVQGSFEETFPLEQDKIDAGEEIRQSLSLAAPTKPLCRPDCKGLCPTCFRNLNDGPCGCKPPKV